MKNIKQLGIWLDNSRANIIEFATGDQQTKIINSDFTSNDRTETLQRSENAMHNKEQQKQETYYKNLSKIIKDFDEVILFGPTNAKNELHNFLKENHQFNDIKIEVKSADKMTDGEQHKFVSDYFTRFDFKTDSK